MKKIIFIALSVLSHQFAIGQCDCESLSGTMSANKTLLTGNCYELSCYNVPNGKTLTIQPGVIIFANSGASLYVERGGVINAAGTSTSPIIFTSIQAASSRAAGDWGEIVIAGKATNNVSGGEITLSRGCGFQGGGDDDHDNSGVFKFVQIHYATNGLTLLSVGDATEVNNIQVTNAANDGFEFLGGTVPATKLFSFNAHGNDYFITQGDRSKLQQLVGFRKDASAVLSGGSSGMIITNDASNSSNTPSTRPIISNYTTFGPLYCNGSASTNFNYGLNIAKNARAGVYNSVILNWKDEGFRIDDVSTVTNTDLDVLNYSFNSMDGNGSDFGTAASWATGCTASSMADWLTLDPLQSCTEDGNQYDASISTTGYNSVSICGSSSNPDFSLNTGTTTFASPDFSSADLSSGFTSTSYRGAFGTTDWTDSWTDWDPFTKEYCEARRMMQDAAQGHLQLTPNPASVATTAKFMLTSAGKVNITVANANDGKAVLSLAPMNLKAGVNEVVIQTSGLRPGVYIVRLISGSQVLQQHLMIQ